MSGEEFLHQIVVQAIAGVEGMPAAGWTAAGAVALIGGGGMLLARAGRGSRTGGDRVGGDQVVVGEVLAEQPRISPCPGNPGRTITTVVRDGIRVAVGQDPSGQPVEIPVPPDLADPVMAMGWTYDDPTHPVRCTAETYAQMVRRA